MASEQCDVCKLQKTSFTIVKEKYLVCSDCCKKSKSGSGRIDLFKFEELRTKKPEG